MEPMKKVTKKDIERVLKGNGWMNQIEIAKKLKAHVLEVNEVLEKLEMDGLVKSRNEK